MQYGNAFGQGLQAAALKPADSFGDDDILYLMGDMATGEIRLSILWEWLHKAAPLTSEDEETGVRAGDTFESIAVRVCSSSTVLKELNPDVDSVALQTGQSLRIRPRPGE